MNGRSVCMCIHFVYTEAHVICVKFLCLSILWMWMFVYSYVCVRKMTTSMTKALDFLQLRKTIEQTIHCYYHLVMYVCLLFQWEFWLHCNTYNANSLHIYSNIDKHNMSNAGKNRFLWCFQNTNDYDSMIFHSHLRAPLLCFIRVEKYSNIL